MEDQEAMDTSSSTTTSAKKSKLATQQQDTAIYAWGNTHCGQLGLEDTEEDQVFLPQEMSAMTGRQVQHMACGHQHTLFLMSDGTVYSCGNNDHGQLGQDSSTNKPGHIVTLDAHLITWVACGCDHSLALTDSGALYTWGSNQEGQLGHSREETAKLPRPRLLKCLQQYRITHVACGAKHNIAMTDSGSLFSWGDNTYGQLGIGRAGGSCDSPQPIASLLGVAMSQLAAGAHHTFALSVSGALFGWGKNSHGQLGTGDSEDRPFPALVKTLRTQMVMHVECGEEHTTALTQSGGVFTFGSGQYGQLGHNSTNDEKLPRKVFELMGVTVIQIACGRRHTLAYVPGSGRVYAFGLGANGQLGQGSGARKVTPVSVVGPFVSREGKSKPLPTGYDQQQACVVRHIYAGGDQSFAYVSSPQDLSELTDLRKKDPVRYLLTVNETVINSVRGVPSSGKLPKETAEILEKVFSSPACLNASFLAEADQHFGTSARHHGIDLNVAKEIFNQFSFASSPILDVYISKTIEEKLVPQLSAKPPDIEAMRLYLTLPCCHLFNVPKHQVALSSVLGERIVQLDITASKVLEKWWSILPKEHLTHFIQIYKSSFIRNLQDDRIGSDSEVLVRTKYLKVALEVLKKLHRVNLATGLFPYDYFYIPEINDRVDIRRAYVAWIQQQAGILTGTALDILNLCNYPFVFDGPAKSILLNTDALFQMQSAIDEAARRNWTRLWVPNIDPVNPCLILMVSRENIVGDTINQLMKQKAHDFKKPLKVVFIGEDAYDWGGVRKEFFLLLLKEIMDPKYGMFKYYDDSRLVWFSTSTFEGTELFYLIGVLCGLAIYNNTIIHLHFPLALYKKLLKKPITLDDLKELNPTVGRSLEELLKYEGNDVEDVFCLTFEMTEEVYGHTTQVELKKSGAKTPVTSENKEEYVDLYLNYVFNKSVAEQFDAFNLGFHKVCGGKVLELFEPEELQAMVIGNENYDWEMLQKNVEYKGDYSASHPTIKAFWKVFHSLSIKDKKKFLLFLTGSDRIPIYGMKALKMVIQPTGGGQEFLPVAHTCFNLLDLPKYTTEDKLKQKLLQAIQHSEGFALV